MEYEEIIEKAKELLEPYKRRYCNELDNVHWVEQNGHSIDGDYCYECIKQAVRNARREYLLEQRKLPVSARDDEFSEFDWAYNYGGGYESGRFNYCDICGRYLCISIIPNEQEFEYILEHLEDGVIDDLKGWKAYSLLYNYIDENDCDEAERKLTLKLAKRVIEILTRIIS